MMTLAPFSEAKLIHPGIGKKHKKQNAMVYPVGRLYVPVNSFRGECRKMENDGYGLITMGSRRHSMEPEENIIGHNIAPEGHLSLQKRLYVPLLIYFTDSIFLRVPL